MRFSEIYNRQKYPEGLKMIPDSEFKSLVADWACQMGKTFGYRRKTRMEHWQEAIDTVYTEIEQELNTVNTLKVQSHPKWTAMMLSAQIFFPEHINIYHPTLVQQERLRRLIENSKITRQLYDKAELLKFLKQDKDLGVKTLTELAISRLQCEMLATSAENLVQRYAANRDGKPTVVSASMGTSDSSSLSQSKTHFTASEQSYTGASISASESGKRSSGGWEATVKAAAEASVSASSHKDFSARAKDLELSSYSGVQAEAAVNAGVDFGASYSCNVPTSYLRRVMGESKFKLIEGRLGASTSALAQGNASRALSTMSKMTFHHETDQNKAFKNYSTLEGEEKEKAKARTKEVLEIVNAEANAEVELKFSIEGHAGLTLGKTFDFGLDVEGFGRLAADCHMKFFINEQEVGMQIGGSAMAGFEAGTKQKITVRHHGRNISVLSVQAHEAVTFGIGIEGRLTALASFNQCVFDTSVTETLGFGAGLSFNTSFSPRGALLLGYDYLAVPTVLTLGHIMEKYHNGPYTQRMKKVCDFLNKQASKAEINQVYLDNMARISTCIAAMHSDAEHLYKIEKFRTPGAEGFTAMSKGEVKDQLNGVSDSVYHDYTTTTTWTDPITAVFGSEASSGNSDISGPVGIGEGMRGEAVTQSFMSSQVRTKGGRLANFVNADKQTLHNAASAYEKANINGKGTCIAYEVLRRDMLLGAVEYS